MSEHLWRFPVLAPSGARAGAVVGRERRACADSTMQARLDGALQFATDGRPFGPRIALEAALVLAGIRARVVFRDRQDRHDPAGRETSMQLPVVLPGERLGRPRLTVRGVPGRPPRTLALFDRDGRRLGRDIDVGKCSDGGRRLGVPLSVGVSAVGWMAAHGWSSRGGPRIWLNGKLVFTRGVIGRIGFGPPHEGERSQEGDVELPLVHPGTTYFFSERTVEGGPAGDAWVWLRFFDMEGNPLGREQLVGHLPDLVASRPGTPPGETAGRR